jgi:spore coat protein U-like protein
MKRLLAVSTFAAAIGFVALMPSRASAQVTATNNLIVSATVVASCRIEPAALPFGNYDGTLNETFDDITVTCNTATPHWVGLGDGLVGSREMQNGANRLPYELFRDAARLVPWDDVDPGVGPYTINAAGSVQQVYGRIAAGHIVPTGYYEDTVVMTVNF